MFELIDSLKVLFFGSLQQWESYTIGTTIVEGNTTTSWVDYLVKYSPHIVALVLTLFFFFILIYIAFRLFRKITQ